MPRCIISAPHASSTPFPCSIKSGVILLLYLIPVCPQRESRATYPRSRRRRTQVFSYIQGTRGTLPREGPFPPVHIIPFSSGLLCSDDTRCAGQQRPNSSIRRSLRTPKSLPTSLEPYSVCIIHLI